MPKDPATTNHAKTAPLIARLLPFQRRLALSESRFLIALWSRQTGKGYTTSFIAVADAMRTPSSNWIISAPTERQAMETLAKCKQWAQAAAVAVSETIGDLEGILHGIHIKAKCIVFPNGSRIYGLPGRPASLRGFSGSLILDEFAFFDDQAEVWKAVYAVIVNPMASVKRIIITSTPAGQGDMFWRLCDENLLNPKPDRKLKWDVQKVTIHEAAKDWEASGKLRGKTAEEYVEEIRSGFDTPEAWTQEFECEFLDTDNVLLPYELITAAESTEASKIGSPIDARYPRFCGIDFGSTNDPTVCWTLEKRGDLLVTVEVLVLRQTNTVAQYNILKDRMLAARLTAFDFTGPGRGFGDMAAQDKKLGQYEPKAHRFGKVQLCTFTAQFKREIFPKMRHRFEAPATLRIPHDTEIRNDLHAMRQTVNAGEYTYWAPRTAEGHSDRCTALALAIHAADSIRRADQRPLIGQILTRFRSDSATL